MTFNKWLSAHVHGIILRNTSSSPDHVKAELKNLDLDIKQQQQKHMST